MCLRSFILLISFPLLVFTQELKTKQPNIIFIFADDWGYRDLGIHGSSFCETPNLDKMAAHGGW